MGDLERTVLPDPLIGSYSIVPVRRALLQVEKQEGAPGVYLFQLLERLKLLSDEIVYVLAPGSTVKDELIEQGFRLRVSSEPGAELATMELVWRAGA